MVDVPPPTAVIYLPPSLADITIESIASPSGDKHAPSEHLSEILDSPRDDREQYPYNHEDKEESEGHTDDEPPNGRKIPKEVTEVDEELNDVFHSLLPR